LGSVRLQKRQHADAIVAYEKAIAELPYYPKRG
jgi:hypothetical protein